MEKIFTLERDFHIYKKNRGFVCRYELEGNVVSLKKLNVHEDMSEETLCFSADVYFNGKKVGVAKNDGRGGCANFYGTDQEGQVAFYDFANNVLSKQFKYCFPTWKMNIYDLLDYLAVYQYDCDYYYEREGALLHHLNTINNDMESIRKSNLEKLNITA